MTTVEEICKFIAEDLAESPQRIQQIYDAVMAESHASMDLADVVDMIYSKVQGRLH